MHTVCLLTLKSCSTTLFNLCTNLLLSANYISYAIVELLLIEYRDFGPEN